jgi:hypothetical protein
VLQGDMRARHPLFQRRQRGYEAIGDTHGTNWLVRRVDVPLVVYHDRASDVPTALTAKQGQYLAFIYYYSKFHGIAPAEADFRRFFRGSVWRNAKATRAEDHVVLPAGIRAAFEMIEAEFGLKS